MAETLSMLSIISFIVAGVALAVAIFLWIFFKIPRVIGDLSGRNARKSIARVRASNEKSGDKSYRPSAANAARGKLTSTMPQTQPEQATEEIKPVGDMPETGLLAENRAKGTDQAQSYWPKKNQQEFYLTKMPQNRLQTIPMESSSTSSEEKSFR